MSGKKDKGGNSEKSERTMTVADYARSFFERVMKQAYGETAEENDKVAGENFKNLIVKLQDAGSKDDIKVPLRVLRDEIGKVYFGSAKKQTSKIETLFKLYDALESGAQEELKGKPDSKQAAAASQVLEELRQRFSRLVIGDTWEAWPELKMLALKRMHKYSVVENEVIRTKAKLGTEISPPTPTGRAGFSKKLSRSFSSVSSSSSIATWESAIEELAKAPGTRLLPIIKLLLLDSADLPAATKEDLAEDAAKEARSELHTQASGISDVGDINQRVSDFNLDDLLGLNEPIQEASPSSADPFQSKPSNGSIAAPKEAILQPPQSGFANSFQPAAPTGPSSQGFGAPAAFAPQAANNGNTENSMPNSQTGFVSPHDFPPLHSFHDGTTIGNAEQPSFDAFEANAFGQAPVNGGSGLATSPSYTGHQASQAVSISRPSTSPMNRTASGQPGGFNPFGLPSPTYAMPVPSYADNSFADFSPVAAAPPPPVPHPMRHAPPPPSGLPMTPPQTSQPPSSTNFSSW